MRRSFVHALLAACLLLAATPLLAWNAAGHRLVAAIAWQELGSAERTALGKLLGAHPDVERWDKKIRAGDEPDFIRFSEASTWADDIRHDPRFFDEGREAATATLPGFPDMARRRGWHYVNLPLGGAPRRGIPEGEIDRRIVGLAKTVADPRSDAGARAYALVWLIHLVADIHQPLHVATRHDAHGEHDAGGNAVAVFDPDHPRHAETNLHAWWDDLPGPSSLRGMRLIEISEWLRRSHPPAVASPREAVGDAAHWREESFRLARDFVYPRAATTAAQPLTITAAYRDEARQIANERIARAGHRLAALLRELLTLPVDRR